MYEILRIRHQNLYFVEKNRIELCRSAQTFEFQMYLEVKTLQIHKIKKFEYTERYKKKIYQHSTERCNSRKLIIPINIRLQ